MEGAAAEQGQIEQLEHWWRQAGCSPNGTASPLAGATVPRARVTSAPSPGADQTNYWLQLSEAETKIDMQTYRDNADEDLTCEIRSQPYRSLAHGFPPVGAASGSRVAALLYTGSFSPIHRGHLTALEHAVKHVRRLGFTQVGAL